MKHVITMLLITVPARLGGQSIASAEVSGLRDGPHQVVINNVRLWYRVAGRPAAGIPPVVFLHGGPGQGSYHFAALVGPYLERSLRMVYFDQRGSGKSERPWTGEYSMATLVEDIEGLRRELGVPQIALIGHSFGGTLALEYAATYPAHVARVVIVAGMWSLPVQGRYQCERIRAAYPALAHAADSAATGPDDHCQWFWNLPASQRTPLYEALMFPDSVVRARLDSTVAASHLPNTGELSAALSRAGLSQYQFTSFRQSHDADLGNRGSSRWSVGSQRTAGAHTTLAQCHLHRIRPERAFRLPRRTRPFCARRDLVYRSSSGPEGTMSPRRRCCLTSA